MPEADRDEREGRPNPEPGDVSRLLEELAQTPDRELREAWDRGLQPGAVVGRFEMLGELGRGGFGVVYEARDRELGRLVAFKAIRPGNRAGAALRQEWLRREAEAAAQLNHPNIVTLHDFGRGDGGPYLILELLHGETLQQRIDRGPLPLREALGVAKAVARALAHAHGCGVLHRDLKPSNVYLCADGAVKVLDFGLARILGAGTTASGGTPAYMAPEQWRGEGEDARTDLFALGVMLHAMLSGNLPFRPSSGGTTASAPPAERLRNVPGALADLVERLIDRDPARRPATARAVLEALEAVELQLPTPARRRRNLLVAVSAAAAAGLVALAVAAVTLRGRLVGGAPASTERLVVSVADFVNETGERELDGLSGMLITSLEQSHRLSVLTRSRMLELARRSGQPDVARIDEGVGRTVARTAGARALLVATIRRFDDVYAIDLQALDPERNEYLFTVSEQSNGRGSIPGLIDRVSERTRRALHETAEEVESSQLQVGDAVTDDLEAYRHFFQGQQCIDGLSHLQDCAAEFRRAIEIDPEFALAHWMLAYTGEFRGAPVQEVRASIEEAMRHVNRVPWKEGMLIRAWAAHVASRDEEALSLYRQVAERFPQDRQAPYLTGDLLFHRGDQTEALPHLERALTLGHPARGVVRSHLVEALGVSGRAAEGLARAEGWAAESRNGETLRVLAVARVLAADPAGAARALREAFDRDRDPEVRLQLASVLNTQGEFAEAEQHLQAILADAGLKPLHPSALAARAHARIYQGRLREAWKLIEQSSAAAAPEQWKVLGDRAIWHAMRGDAAALWAEISATGLRADKRFSNRFAFLLAFAGDVAHAEELARIDPPREGSRQARAFAATVAWKKGEYDRALETAPSLELPFFQATHIAGEILLEAGRLGEAAQQLERMRTLVSGDPQWRAWGYPRSLYLLATTYEKLGDTPKALERVDELLQLWRRADPDMPLLAEARALKERLSGQPRRVAR